MLIVRLTFDRFRRFFRLALVPSTSTRVTPTTRFPSRCLRTVASTDPWRHRRLREDTRPSQPPPPGLVDRLAEGLVDGRFIRRQLVRRDQEVLRGVETPGHLLDDRLGVLDRPAPGDDRQDQAVFGVVGDMVPVVTALGVIGVGRVSLSLFLAHERPRLVELDFAGSGGESSTNSSWVSRACFPASRASRVTVSRWTRHSRAVWRVSPPSSKCSRIAMTFSWGSLDWSHCIPLYSENRA